MAESEELTQPAKEQAPPGDEPIGTTLPPDSIRNSPEYREVLRQNRALAREAGQAKARENEARAELERSRQAAEAERAAMVNRQVADILGAEGVNAWNEIAELSATDPVEAAKRIAALAAAQAQSKQSEPPAPASETAKPTEEEVETKVPEQQQPAAAAASRSVTADSPLTAPDQNDPQRIIEALEKQFQATAERNQNPATRNRVTMKERAGAMISYLGAAYLKAGARPKQ